VIEKTVAGITKDIISYCLEFFGLYLSWTLVTVLLLPDGSTYCLSKSWRCF